VSLQPGNSIYAISLEALSGMFSGVHPLSILLMCSAINYPCRGLLPCLWLRGATYVMTIVPIMLRTIVLITPRVHFKDTVCILTTLRITSVQACPSCILTPNLYVFYTASLNSVFQQILTFRACLIIVPHLLFLCSS
jgi:hypothetical protein